MEKKLDKKTIEYICQVIRAVKITTKQREIIAEFIIQKPEYLLDLIQCLGKDYYKIVPKA